MAVGKDYLVKSITKEGEITKAQAGKIVDTILEAIRKGVVEDKDHSVRLIGFGTFNIVERAARKGLNPATKKLINIPASKTVKFKVSKAFKELVNPSKKKK